MQAICHSALQQNIHNIKYKNKLASTDKDKCTLFAKYLEKSFTMPDLNNFSKENFSLTNQFVRYCKALFTPTFETINPPSENRLTFCLFSTAELKVNIKHLNTASGEDGISNSILKNLPEDILKYLAILLTILSPMFTTIHAKS